MRLEKRQPTGREKNEAALQLLEKLREQLYCSNISIVRQSAFHLSWMQEDGLEILREALLGNTPRRAKSAAAYGLRKMRGRMRKSAEQTLIEGLSHSDPPTALICRNALVVLKRGVKGGKRSVKPKGKGKGRKFDIKAVPGKDRRRRSPQRGRRPDDQAPSRRR